MLVYAAISAGHIASSSSSDHSFMVAFSLTGILALQAVLMAWRMARAEESREKSTHTVKPGFAAKSEESTGCPRIR